MKKLAFAIQVFSLIAMFPLYVVAEFNHGNERLPDDINSPAIIKEPTKIDIKSISTSAEENGTLFLIASGINRY